MAAVGARPGPMPARSAAFGNVSGGNAGTQSSAPFEPATHDAGLPPPSFDAGACGLSGTPTAPTAELCDNGLDDDHNGFIDEVCTCTLGATQPCFGGRPSEVDLPNCMRGTQTCTGTDEFHGWGKCEGWSCGDVAAPEESCDDGGDEDCDGAIDEGCELDVPVDIDGDCLSVACPPQAPYPSGCELTMEGGDSRGCVANTPGQSTVYFQEGDACPIFGIAFGDVGHIAGRLLCSTQMPSEPLSATSCPIDKSEPLYPADASGCPVP